MRTTSELKTVIARIDGRSYNAYHAIKGRWSYGDYVVGVDHVQGDPYAAPSRLRAFLEPEVAGLRRAVLSSLSRRTGVAAHIARAFGEEAAKASSQRGSGKSGLLHIEAPGQEVIPQTAVLVGEDGGLEARFAVGLPAKGRRVLGREARELLVNDLAGAIERSLAAPAHRPDDLIRAAETNEDADALRALLPAHGIVAFVADGALLPRCSGVDDRPLTGDDVVAFESPESLRVELTAPNRGSVTGLGISEGVTLVVGGGFHGKSTLLRAVEMGVYNHRPGDGREYVVTVSSAVKIRAEDGRSVSGVDISPFIDGLPLGTGTKAFATPNASGSTSQAAALVEALEAGASLLLVDEDTAATNFMIRDRRMQELVPKAREPITPFVDRVEDLYELEGVSSMLVIGGSGDYLDVADVVISMSKYCPIDVTDRAREVAGAHPTGRIRERAPPLGARLARVPAPASVDPRRGRKAYSLRVPDKRKLLFGTDEIDLSALEQIVSWAQARSIGEALILARRQFVDGRRTVREVLAAVEGLVEREGLDVLDPRQTGELTAFRRFELAAALNRLRTLQVRQVAGTDSPLRGPLEAHDG